MRVDVHHSDAWIECDEKCSRLGLVENVQDVHVKIRALVLEIFKREESVVGAPRIRLKGKYLVDALRAVFCSAVYR